MKPSICETEDKKVSMSMRHASLQGGNKAICILASASFG